MYVCVCVCVCILVWDKTEHAHCEIKLAASVSRHSRAEAKIQSCERVISELKSYNTQSEIKIQQLQGSAKK